MKKCFAQLCICLCFMMICSAIPNNSQVNAAASEPYGLNALTPFDRLPYLKLDTVAGGQSSRQRDTIPCNGNCDWNNFLGTSGTEKILLDQKGPGTVYRMWFTGFNAATDYIKVYFDGSATPAINMLIKDMTDGTHAPFLAPLVASNTVSSGGFTSYLPLPYHTSIKIVSNATDPDSFYYNIGYQTYSPDTNMTTWTGSEDSSAARAMWNNAGADPKSDTGNSVVSGNANIAPSAAQTLLDIAGPRSVSSIKLKIPGVVPPATVTDAGRANKGYSQFVAALNPSNTGVTLKRRFDYGVANQRAGVYMDGAYVGDWYDAGSDTSFNWRDSTFFIPASFTAGKSSITVKVQFVSSANDWNEF